MLTLFGLKPGDVFTWDNYPFNAATHNVKKRWLILLGYFIIEEIVFTVTTTTRFEHYGKGKLRERHVYFNFPAGTGGLVQDSIIDFSQDFQSNIPLSAFMHHQTDIMKTGTLNQDNINKLVTFFEKTPTIPKITKRRVYECLREAGFTVKK
jgi:hypothetical protein